MNCADVYIYMTAMSLHAIFDIDDTTGYTPSIYNLGEIFKPAKRLIQSTTFGLPAPCLNSDDLPTHNSIRTSDASQAPHVLHLFPKEISEIEKSVRYFQGKGRLLRVRNELIYSRSQCASL